MSHGYQNYNHLPGAGPVSYNWYGSHPTYIIDTNTFEPNFRLFDWQLGEMSNDPPNRSLIERVWKVPEGERHWQVSELMGGNVRCAPLICVTLINTMLCNYCHCKLMNRPPGMMRWSFMPYLVMCAVWHNGLKYIVREKAFARDFQRNQVYAMEELKRLRDEQRAKEALFTLKYVDDPYSEYRLKAFQVASRFS